MRITIRKEDYDTMIRHAVSVCPEEACGLIAGTDREDGTREIQKVYLMENTDHTNEHFSIDPIRQLQAIKDIRKAGLRALGIWHSHPETPSRPSEEDKRLANDAIASYLILSLEVPDHPVLRAFHIEGEQDNRTVRIEELIIL